MIIMDTIFTFVIHLITEIVSLELQICLSCGVLFEIQFTKNLNISESAYLDITLFTDVVSFLLYFSIPLP